MQNWETTEGFNSIPEEWMGALSAILDACRKMAKSNVVDWGYITEAADTLDKAQRGCATANAMPAQQDLSDLWQRLDDLFMDYTQRHTSPADALARLNDFAEDLGAVLIDNGKDLEQGPTNVV